MILKLILFSQIHLKNIKNDTLIVWGDKDTSYNFDQVDTLKKNTEKTVVLDQVENGVAIRMAIIYLLASKLNISIT